MQGGIGGEELAVDGGKGRDASDAFGGTISMAGGVMLKRACRKLADMLTNVSVLGCGGMHVWRYRRRGGRVGVCGPVTR